MSWGWELHPMQVELSPAKLPFFKVKTQRPRKIRLNFKLAAKWLFIRSGVCGLGKKLKTI
jgi:hypothetical protein